MERGGANCFFRYASLYFCAAVDKDENELIVLELIHRYVELLDKYFGSVKTAISHNNQFEMIVCVLSLGLRTGHYIQF